MEPSHKQILLCKALEAQEESFGGTDIYSL